MPTFILSLSSMAESYLFSISLELQLEDVNDEPFLPDQLIFLLYGNVYLHATYSCRRLIITMIKDIWIKRQVQEKA